MSEGIKNPNRLSDRRLQRELRRLESKQKSEEGVMEQKFQETLDKLGIVHVELSKKSELQAKEVIKAIQTAYNGIKLKIYSLVTTDADEAVDFKLLHGNNAIVCLVTAIDPVDKNSLPSGHEDDLQG